MYIISIHAWAFVEFHVYTCTCHMLNTCVPVLREEVYSPAGLEMEGEEFIVVNSLGAPLSHWRSQSSGKVTPPSNELKRRMWVSKMRALAIKLGICSYMASQWIGKDHCNKKLNLMIVISGVDLYLTFHASLAVAPSFTLYRSTSLPQLDQVSGGDTPADASGLEKRVATLQQEVSLTHCCLVTCSKSSNPSVPCHS